MPQADRMIGELFSGGIGDGEVVGFVFDAVEFGGDDLVAAGMFGAVESAVGGGQ